MLDLDSPLWASIPASCGMSNDLTVELLRQVRAGDDSAYAELYHQVCHQFSVGAVAYLVVPHLVDIACNRPLNRRVWPLTIVGTVAAARSTYSRSAAVLREEWSDEYLKANDVALRLTAEALAQKCWVPAESRELLAALAALHGHNHLAMHLFLSGTELSCPECGEYIKFSD